ncbi:MAG: dienelactone hydrolase family protein [Fimbriimonadaceae bacterium]|nr:dienelactone hydrolase family protein [Fimbriimonadaceae bacterium]
MNEARRAQLWSLLGELPKYRPITAELRHVEQADGYRHEHLLLDLNGLELVPASVLVPDGLTAAAPGVVFHHSHGGHYPFGREELLRDCEWFQRPWGPELARRGYVVIAIDNWCFGERSHTSEMDTFKRMLWHGQVLWGMMMFDSHRAVDYLVSRPEVDPTRIASIGLSMGCTAAWWLAALDPRVQCTVGEVCLTEYQSLLANHALDCHGVYYFVPSLLRRFQTEDIIDLIAPRAFLSLTGDLDRGTPPEGIERIREVCTPTWTRAGAAERLRLLRYPVGHLETPEMRAEALTWLARWL